MDPVPIAPIASAGADAIVAVSLNGSRVNALPDSVREQTGVRPLPRVPSARPFGRSARTSEAPLPPDLSIEVPVDSCGALEFHRAEEMIDLGRTSAQEALARSGLGS